MTPAAYDEIALDFKSSEQLPFRRLIESYTLFGMAGRLTGLKVLDLACGDGFYTRKIKAANAAKALGVDISQAMIRHARREEERNPLGCQYEVHEVGAMPVLDDFDLAVAMYLLNYARTREELTAFCSSVFDQLKPGGRFIGFNDNPANDPANYPKYLKYGFTKQGMSDRKEGAPIRYTFYNPNGTFFQFNSHYLHPDTYAEAFEKAGFADFQWQQPALDPKHRDGAYWDRFLADPPVIGFSAVRP